MQHHPEVHLFLHDSAHLHYARVTRAYLTDSEIQALPWMPFLPDLLPLKLLWDALDQYVLTRHPHSWNDFMHVLQEKWNAIPQDRIQRMICIYMRSLY